MTDYKEKLFNQIAHQTNTVFVNGEPRYDKETIGNSKQIYNNILQCISAETNKLISFDLDINLNQTITNFLIKSTNCSENHAESQARHLYIRIIIAMIRKNKDLFKMENYLIPENVKAFINQDDNDMTFDNEKGINYIISNNIDRVNNEKDILKILVLPYVDGNKEQHLYFSWVSIYEYAKQHALQNSLDLLIKEGK